MKIFYGVQGTGNGHISRARIMAKKFSDIGVKVDFLFSGRPNEQYFDMDLFADYKTKTGISFACTNGRVSILSTLKNLKLKQFIQDINQLDLSQYDLVLNDFEPISAWAAKLQKIPSISISHQASFLQNIPMKDASWFDKTLLKHFAPCQFNLGVHWHHFGNNIIPPFIEPAENTPCNPKKIMVYLPFESLKTITELLNDFCDYEFYCYHPDIKINFEHEHIHFKTPSKNGFKQDLIESNGIIANAGFELSSEALNFGKRILLKPLVGQFEQSSNAHTLELLGLATVMPKMNDEALGNWLKNTTRGQVQFPHDPQPLIDWILAGQYHNTEKLCQELWQQVVFPEHVSQKISKLT